MPTCFQLFAQISQVLLEMMSGDEKNEHYEPLCIQFGLV